MTVGEAFSRNLKRIISDNGINVPKMVRITQISRTAMYGYMNGDVAPSIEVAWCIAKYLGISIDELTAGATHRNKYRKGEKKK